jgi:hypothetical protein
VSGGRSSGSIDHTSASASVAVDAMASCGALTYFASDQVIVGLAPDPQPCHSIAAEDDRRPQRGIIVIRHRKAVGSGDRDGDEIPDLWIGQCNVRSDDIASLAMAANQICDYVLFVPTANHEGSEVLSIEGMFQIVTHSSINGNVGSGSPLNSDGAIQGKANGGDQGTARLN